MNVVYIVGMVVGTVMAGATALVLVKQQSLELWSFGFSALGVMLIGMSVWTQFRIRISPEGAEIEALRNQVVETAQAVGVVVEELEAAATALETNRSQFNELARLLATRETLPAADVQRLVEPQNQPPQVDCSRLEGARINLQRAADVRVVP